MINRIKPRHTDSASGQVFVEMKGGTCGGQNVQGLHVRVLDNNIWKRLPVGGRDGAYEGTKGTPDGHTPPAIGPGGTGSDGGVSNTTVGTNATLPAPVAPAPAGGGTGNTTSSADWGQVSSSVGSAQRNYASSLHLDPQQNAAVSKGPGPTAFPVNPGGFTIDVTSSGGASTGPSSIVTPPEPAYYPPNQNASSHKSSMDVAMPNGTSAAHPGPKSSVNVGSAGSTSLSKVCKRPRPSGGAKGDGQPGQKGLTGGCEFGKWQCDHNKLRLCGNLTMESAGEWANGRG